MVTQKAINLTDEAMEVLENIKEREPSFNLSAFVSANLIDDIHRLTYDELLHKIKEAEVEMEGARMKLEELTKILPMAKSRQEAEDAKIDEAVEIIRRKMQSGEDYKEIAVFWAGETKQLTNDLIELAEREIKERVIVQVDTESPEFLAKKAQFDAMKARQAEKERKNDKS